MLEKLRCVNTNNTTRKQLDKIIEEVQELNEAERRTSKSNIALRVKAAEEAVDVIVATMTYLNILQKDLKDAGFFLDLEDVADLINHKNQVRGRFR